MNEFCEYGCGQIAIKRFKTGSKKFCCSDHQTQCPEVKKRNSQRCKNRIPWNKGITSEDDSRILTGTRNGMYGKTHTPEVREQSIQRNKGKWAGENNPWYGKTRNKELSPRWIADLDRHAISEYRNKVAVLTKKTYSQFKSMINPLSLPRTRAGISGGYHLDHKLSVVLGYSMGLPPEVIAHQNNLRMVPWKDNVVKGSTSYVDDDAFIMLISLYLDVASTISAYIVVGGELITVGGAEFKDPDRLHVVGTYARYCDAHSAWKGAAQRTVDNAHMRYLIVPVVVPSM